MFFTVVAAILGTAYYVGRYFYSQHQKQAHKREDEQRIQARVDADRSFSDRCMDEEGSEEFRRMYPRDREFSTQVCTEANAILHSIPGLEGERRIYPVPGYDNQRYLLAAFLHFVPTGKAYSWWIIAKGPNPFGMSVEHAEAVMLWGVQQLRSRGYRIGIVKAWDMYGQLLYGWTVPLGARKWCSLESQDRVLTR